MDDPSAHRFWFGSSARRAQWPRHILINTQPLRKFPQASPRQARHRRGIPAEFFATTSRRLGPRLKAVPTGSASFGLGSTSAFSPRFSLRMFLFPNDFTLFPFLFIPAAGGNKTIFICPCYVRFTPKSGATAVRCDGGRPARFGR